MFPVGRLDRDTEGLLILTNDGELAQLLTHPSHGVEKEYLAEVEGVPTAGELRRLREGVELDDGPTRPARVRHGAGGERSRERARRDRGEGRPQADGAPHVLARSAIRCGGWCAPRIGPLSDRSSGRRSGGS